VFTPSADLCFWLLLLLLLSSLLVVVVAKGKEVQQGAATNYPVLGWTGW